MPQLNVSNHDVTGRSLTGKCLEEQKEIHQKVAKIFIWQNLVAPNVVKGVQKQVQCQNDFS